MEKKLIRFPSIGQFRNVVKTIRDRARYKGQDENGNPVYYTNPAEYTIPTLTFIGKVKLHGTCASVCYNDSVGYYAQSKKQILTVEKDNYGFAMFILHHVGEDVLDNLFEPIKKIIDTSKNTIVIYGEFAGGSLQKGVAINGLDKMFVTFAVKVKPHDESLSSYWLNYEDPSLGLERDVHPHIYSINVFGTWSLDIDFNEPAEVQNKLVELTNEVEKECPAGKYFGRKLGEDNTTGEGIVWSYMDGNALINFKVKGAKHSTTRVKKLATVSPEKLESIKEFVEYTVTENRLNQAIEELFTRNGIEPDMKNTGEFVKWVKNDIIKEDLDTLAESGLEIKEVAAHINRATVNWWREFLAKF